VNSPIKIKPFRQLQKKQACTISLIKGFTAALQFYFFPMFWDISTDKNKTPQSFIVRCIEALELCMSYRISLIKFLHKINFCEL